MGRIILLLVSLAAASGTLATAAAQAPDADAEAVLAVVHRLFDGLRAGDTTRMRAVFHPDARLVTTGTRHGQPTSTFVAIDDWLAGIGRAPGGLDEQIYAPEVRADDNLATVWTFYTFHVGDRFSHCGYNAFQLARSVEGWLITQITDTRRSEPCELPPR